jgi:hypothetical protein
MKEFLIAWLKNTTIVASFVLVVIGIMCLGAAFVSWSLPDLNNITTDVWFGIRASFIIFAVIALMITLMGIEDY